MVSAFLKFAIAMCIFAIGMGVFIFATNQVVESGLISGWYVVVCYMLLPIAELCIMPIAISLVTQVAPPGKTALMFGVYAFGQAVASYLNGVFSSQAEIDFPLITRTDLIHAAGIYRQVFSQTAVWLLIFAVLAGVVWYGLSRRSEVDVFAQSIGGCRD